MKKKKKLIAVLLILLAVSSYFLYFSILQLTSKPVRFIETPVNVTPASKNQSSFLGEFQFYPNMRFAKTNLSYKIEASCSEQKKQRIEQAFRALEQETGVLKFSPASSEIAISCNETPIPISEDYFIAGEGGPLSIINTSAFNIIENGTVLLLYNQSQCNNYNIELHELLHVFGFKHSGNKESIMYNLTYCNQVLTNDIAKELKRLYAIPSLPDLYLSNVSATKQGVYLNFNLEVKNRGLKKAENISLEVYADNEKVDEMYAGEINYGEGKILQVVNLRLQSRQVSKIKFNIKGADDLNPSDNSMDLILASD